MFIHSYNPLHLYRLSGKVKDINKKEVPGPGQYEVPVKVISGPKFGFGTSKRDSKVKNESPGPGHYKVPVKVATVEKYALPNQNEDFRFV
jgi:hypothetical protein